MYGEAVVGEEGVEEGQRTHPCGVPVFRMRVNDVQPPILMFCGLRKSSIHVHSELPMPRLLSLWISLWGMTMLNAELKSTNSTLTYMLG